MDSITLKNVLSRSIMYEATPSISSGISSIRICKIPDVGYFKFFLTFKKSKIDEDNTTKIEYSTIEFEISNKQIVRHFCHDLDNESNKYKYLLEIKDTETSTNNLFCYYDLTDVNTVDIELEYATNYVDEVYIEDDESFTISDKTVDDLVQNGIMYFNSNLNLSNNSLSLDNLKIETLQAKTYTNSINLGNWEITKATDNKIVISLKEK